LDGHEDDIFSCAFNYSGDTIITGSKDNTCRIWRDEAMMKLNAGGKDVLDSTATTASTAQKQD
jgi:WD40 repeat protein